MTGPCRVTITSYSMSSPPATTMVSGRTSMSTHSPWYSYWAGLSGLTFSMKRSWVSTDWLVTPQAICSLCPMTTPGVPGKENPMSWYGQSSVVSMQWSPFWYQMEGIWMAR